MSWVLYVLALTGLLTAAAWGAERLCAALRLPTRWPWLLAMGASCLLVPLAWSGVLTAPDEPAVPVTTTMPAATPSVASDPGPERGLLAGVLGALNPAGTPAVFVNRALRSTEEALAGAASRMGMDRSGAGSMVASLSILLWGAASLALLLTLATTWQRLAHSRRRWPRARLLGHEVRMSTELGPAVVGIRRPEIVMPTRSLSLEAPQLGLVLLHEREHLTSGDTRVLAAGLLPLLLFPWNPFLWIQNARLREAIEVDCDARVLRSGIPARQYAGTLLDVGGDRFPGLSPSPALGGPTRLLERRIRSMKPRTRTQRLPAGLAGAALAVIFLVLACEVDTPTVDGDDPVEAQALQTAEEASPDEDGTITVRGRQSISTHPSPLIVIDGVIQSSGQIGVAPENIVSIEVVKGSDAREQYGERANEGAILVTTVDAPDGPPSPPTPTEPGSSDDAESDASIEAIELPPEVDSPPPPADIEDRREVLEGMVSGARVMSRSADDRTTVRLRGRTSGTSGAAPLIVVDGIIQASGSADHLDPDEILDIEIVKGSAASERYGSRAAEGVILITTRGAGDPPSSTP